MSFILHPLVTIETISINKHLAGQQVTQYTTSPRRLTADWVVPVHSCSIRSPHLPQGYATGSRDIKNDYVWINVNIGLCFIVQVTLDPCSWLVCSAMEDGSISCADDESRPRHNIWKKKLKRDWSDTILAEVVTIQTLLSASLGDVLKWWWSRKEAQHNGCSYQHNAQRMVSC